MVHLGGHPGRHSRCSHGQDHVDMAVPKSWTHPARGIGPTYTAATRPERVSDVSTLAALPSSRAVVMPSGTYPLVVRKLTWHQVKAHPGGDNVMAGDDQGGEAELATLPASSGAPVEPR